MPPGNLASRGPGQIATPAIPLTSIGGSLDAAAVSVAPDAPKQPGGDRSHLRFAHRDPSARQVALSIATIFAICGLGWVLLSDLILYGFTADSAFIARFETAKGWVFVLAASVLVYLVTFHRASGVIWLRRLNQAVVDSIADGLLLLGHDRTIAHVNPAAERILGCSKEELVGMGAREFSRRFRVSYPDGALVPPESFVSQRVFEEGGPLRYKAVLHPDGGGERIVSVIAAAVRIEAGAPARWVVSVMHDITASEKIDRMRDNFFAAAAHSLKTPVAVIKANVQALLPGETEAQHGAAASLLRQCDRVDRLVQNLSVLARARSEALTLHPHAMEVGPLAETIAAAAERSHRREIRTETEGSLWVYADQERLALVIRNHIYEAGRLSMPATPLEIVARGEGDSVVVGFGYQPTPEREEAIELYLEHDDIGVGRSVAQAIIEAHGGSLDEEVTADKVYQWIRLPRAPREDQ